MATPIYLEVGTRKTFACSLEWPGWCRAAKTEDLAIEALAAYVDRYRPVAERASVRFPKNVADDFEVVERIKGDGTTDFGAPGKVATADHEEPTAAKAAKLAKLVVASWDAFDDVVKSAPAQLRKGPRGGGRDRDKIVDHVAESEVGYARSIGLRLAKASPAERRQAIADAVKARQRGNWPTAYAARRIAWHVLDHAWEIEDKSE